MELEKYLLIDCTESMHKHEFSVKIVEGFIKSNVTEALEVKEGWVPQGNDKLYFFPGCTVPRFKVREHYDCTIKLDKATAAFVSKDNLAGSNSVFTNYNNLYHPELSALEGLRNWFKTFKDVKTKTRIEALIESVPKGNVLLGKKLWNDCFYDEDLSDKECSFFDAMHAYENTSRYWIGRKAQSLFAFNRGASWHTCNVYFEEELLPVLNEGKMVIDAEKYEELRSFGKSENTEDHTLLMELISNADFEKSAGQIILLVHEFGRAFKQLPGAKHVNFKSLLTLLDMDVQDLDNANLHRTTVLLRKHKKFTKTNAQILSELCKYTYNNLNGQDIWRSGPVLNTAFMNIQLDESND